MASMVAATGSSPSGGLVCARNWKATKAQMQSVFHSVPPRPLSALRPRAASSRTLKLWSGEPMQRMYVHVVGPRRSRRGGVLATTCSVVISTETLRWVATAASVALLLVKNTGVRKPLVVLLLAVTVPEEVTSWIRGDYGLWLAFVGLLVRLFYSIPGELELPLAFLMLVITAPVQLLSQRCRTAAAVVSLVVASILAYQHFSRAGSVNGAFRGNNVIASIAVILVVLVPVLFFLQGVY